MDWRASLRSRVKAGRRNGSLWVRLLDKIRLLSSAEGRAQLWTLVAHRDDVHQITPHTAPERYPELFDMAAELAPNAKSILSFGCSTGEELVSIRVRFPGARIVGAEVNPRSRKIAEKRMSADALSSVVAPSEIEGEFDVIFALAVLQREPHKVEEMQLADLSRHYPFERFDAAVGSLVRKLRPAGLLCAINAHYPIECASSAGQLEAIPNSPVMMPPLFGRDSHRLERPVARTMFRKRS